MIVAFENRDMLQRFSEALESTGTAQCLSCHSGDQVRRLLGKQHAYCVVCSPHLTDGPAEWLLADLPPSCSMLLVGPQHMLDAWDSQDIFKLATPLRREEAVTTVRLLLQFGRKVERLVKARRNDSQQLLVEQAKQLLMHRQGMSEEEAHRTLQKQSMDGGCRLVQTARQIISQYSSYTGHDNG